MIQHATHDDRNSILTLARVNGFSPEELEVVGASFDEHVQGHSNDLWLLSHHEEEPAGILYCNQEVMTNNAWNILMLMIHPDHHGQGHGRTLMTHVEDTLKKRGARFLIVETSSLDDFERARSFYEKCGYTHAATIPDFYDDGDGKVVFTKKISG